VLRSICNSYLHFSKFLLGYGFGAKTVAAAGDPSDLFSLTGDFADPIIKSQEEMLNCYKNTLKSVVLTLPVHYGKILKFACDLAEFDYQRGDNKAYYVLVLAMAGLIDDFEDSLNQVLRAAKLPLSIVVVKIGNTSEEENDSTQFIKKAMPSFAENERHYLDIVPYNYYKARGYDVTQNEFEENLIKNVPDQVAKFYELNYAIPQTKGGLAKSKSFMGE